MPWYIRGVTAPAVRARTTQEALRFLDHVRPGTTQAVRALVDPASLKVIDETPGTEWIPLEHDRRVPKAILDLLGPSDALAYWRRFLPGHLDSPLLRTITDTAIRLLGHSPATFVRAMPRLFPVLYRDYARARAADHGEDHAELLLDDVHPEVMASEGYLVAFRGLLLGVLDLCGVPGTLDVTTDPHAHVIRFRLRWENRPES